MANPRIDELRRRIDREPGSRLFAQLAEELRKEGELTESIRVARAGLQGHPNYPSARLTLGRALFEAGQLGPARVELESVLRGAPDNILAARMLGECLAGLGDPGAALLQFRAAARLAPGDAQIEAQLRVLEVRLAKENAAPAPAARPQGQAAVATPGPTVGRPAGLPPPPPAARATSSAAPAPLVAAGPALAAPLPPPPVLPAVPPAAAAAPDFEDVFEPAGAWQRPGRLAGPAEDAILLLEDEAPTLPGSPYPRAAAPAANPVLAPRPPAPPSAPLPPADEASSAPAADPSPVSLPVPAPAVAEAPVPMPALASVPPTPALPEPEAAFEVPISAAPPSLSEALGELPPASAAADGASTAAFAALTPDAPMAEPIPAPTPPPLVVPPPPVLHEPAPAPPAPELSAPQPLTAEPPAPPLSTPTLAELYFEQGFYDRALEVYEEILEREPTNERARARLIEIRAFARSLEGPAPPDPRAARRQEIERTITRLEQMLAAVRRA